MTCGLQCLGCRIVLGRATFGALLHTCCCCLVVTTFAGCRQKPAISQGSMNDYKKTVLSAASVLPEAVQIENLYGDADHFITHYAKEFSGATRQWNSEAYFGGRYSITMQVNVLVDYKNNRISQVVDSPTFVLIEYYQVDHLQDGRLVAHSRGGKIFTLDEWKKFHASGGDFSALGLKKDSNPTEGFDDYVAAFRKDRIHVCLTSKGRRNESIDE